MADAIHETIGARVRRFDIVQKAEELFKDERLKRYTRFSFEDVGVDQVTIWFIWGTMLISLFLYCTVSAVRLAVG